MRYMTCRDILNIPPELVQPVLELNKYILQELDIYLTVADTFKFWTYVSMSFGHWWLNTDFTLEDVPRNVFIARFIGEYCYDAEPMLGYE